MWKIWNIVGKCLYTVFSAIELSFKIFCGLPATLWLMGKVNTFCERSEWEYGRTGVRASRHHCLAGLLYNFIVIVHYIISMLYSLYTTCYAASLATRATSNTIDVTHSMNTLSTLLLPAWFSLCIRHRRLSHCRLIKYQPHCWWSVIFIERLDSTWLDLLLFWFCLHLCRRLCLYLRLPRCSLSGVCCRLLLL